MCSAILTSTTFSTTLEMKLRLEIGRYELGSFGSRFCFFNSGRMIAFLFRSGNLACWNEALHMPAITGAMTSPASLTNQVGTGSSEHCLADDCLKIDATSSAVVGPRTVNGSWTVRSSMMGGGAAAMQSIFFVKYCSCSAALS